MKKLFDSYKGIIEFAIGHEIKAYQLYTDLSKMMITPEIRELCKELAKEELEHKAKLEKESAKRGELVSGVNLSKYKVLNSDVNIFKNRIEMFMFAIKKEQASIQLYQDLAAIVKNEDSRQLFQWLAQQESEHKRRFGSEYKNCLK
jgi:rubrerythrin